MLDVEAFVARSLPDGQSKPTSLIFALNVGKDSSGNVFNADPGVVVTGQCAMLIGKKRK